jgi:hypothetical protein
MPKSSPLYLLSAIYDESTVPIAVYSDEAAAQAEAERLMAEYKKTYQAHAEWFQRRIGHAPELLGYEEVEVSEVDDRTSPKTPPRGSR